MIGVKHDAGKRQWRLLPWRALEQVVLVLEYGAQKYSEENWRIVPDAKRRYIDAALRHLIAYAGGEEVDAESGLPHLACAVCSMLFLLELIATRAVTEAP